MHSELILKRLRNSVVEKENMDNKCEVTLVARKVASSFVGSIFDTCLASYPAKVAAFNGCGLANKESLGVPKLTNGTADLISCHVGEPEKAKMDEWSAEVALLGICVFPERLLSQLVLPQLLKETRLFRKLEECVVSEQYTLNEEAKDREFARRVFQSWNKPQLRLIKKFEERDALKRLLPLFADCIDMGDDKVATSNAIDADSGLLHRTELLNLKPEAVFSKRPTGDKTVTTISGQTNSFKIESDLEAEVPFKTERKQKKFMKGVFNMKLFSFKKRGFFQTPSMCWNMNRASAVAVNTSKGEKKHSLRDIFRMSKKYSGNADEGKPGMNQVLHDGEMSVLPSAVI